MNQPPQGFGVGKFQPSAPAQPSGFAQQAPANGFTAPAGPAAPVTAGFGVSPWKGIQSAKPRDPFMCVGEYVVRVISNELGLNPNSREQSFKGHVEIVWAQEGSHSRVGEHCAVVFKLHGRSAEMNYQRSKAYIMAAAGFDDDAAYDAFDPNGDFGMAVVGQANAYSQAGMTIVGRFARVRVSRGNDVLDKTTKAPTGDYYREYSWSPVEESSQTVRKPGT